VGAEEQGLLGSLYLAQHPPAQPGNLAAVINIDGVNIIGPTRDVNVIGLGKSNLDELVDGIARWQNRVVTPDEFPDRGYYYRSDQFSLAKIGVPGVYLHSGINVIDSPRAGANGKSRSGPRRSTISRATSTATTGTCAAPSMTSGSYTTSACKLPSSRKCRGGIPATSSKPPANPPSKR
jgi:Zn-dependent M28 family amino/carboxypeptidase